MEDTKASKKSQKVIPRPVNSLHQECMNNLAKMEENSQERAKDWTEKAQKIYLYAVTLN
jgi:hypothetical protein